MLSAVVVNYNARDYLLDCVRSLRADGVDEIVVADNDSHDGSVDALRAVDGAVRVLSTGTNLGFGAAANRFDFEPEITAKVLRLGHSIYEVPISYSGREFHEGKKITWHDGLRALTTLVRERVRKPG